MQKLGARSRPFFAVRPTEMHEMRLGGAAWPMGSEQLYAQAREILLDF